MHADAESLRAISQNVANSQTPAYRREIALARTAFDELAASGSVEALAASALAGAGSEGSPLLLGSAIDVRPGTLQATGEPLNLAIEGAGFFVLGTAEGELLTRRGDFRLDALGRLVTAAGHPVMGTNGPIQVGAGRASVSADGTVRVADAAVDRIRIVDVPEGASLHAAGDGAFLLAAGEQPFDSSAATVRQGYLETSNVQSVNEMIALMETMRHFETAQRFIRGYDDMVGQAITTLGKI